MFDNAASLVLMNQDDGVDSPQHGAQRVVHYVIVYSFAMYSMNPVSREAIE